MGMDFCKAMNDSGGMVIPAAAVVVVGAPLITPLVMTVGALAMPVFGAKALYHYGRLQSLKKQDGEMRNIIDQKKDLTKAILKNELKMLESIDEIARNALWVVPGGFFYDTWGSLFDLPPVAPNHERIAYIKHQLGLIKLLRN